VILIIILNTLYIDIGKINQTGIDMAVWYM